MKERRDDFSIRREHLKNMSDEQLKAYFLELSDKLVDPLLKLAYTNTSKSIERSVLLRMGVSSIDAKVIVDKLDEKDLLRKGAGHCLFILSKDKNISLDEAAKLILEDDGLEYVLEYFGYYE